MNNIFENAYFGKSYKTRDGRKAIYLGYNKFGVKYWHQLVLENTPDINSNVRIKEYDNDGVFYSADKSCIYSDDIVSEYPEEINEEVLDKLAFELYPDECLYNSDDEIIDTISNHDTREVFKKYYRNILETYYHKVFEN